MNNSCRGMGIVYSFSAVRGEIFFAICPENPSNPPLPPFPDKIIRGQVSKGGMGGLFSCPFVNLWLVRVCPENALYPILTPALPLKGREVSSPSGRGFPLFSSSPSGRGRR